MGAMQARCLISVVVCTYNRADLLQICLDTLVRQDASPGSYEIIVVDNNSTDDTRAVVESLQARWPNMRYVFEQKQGLSHARNCGARAARGDYVAFVDDECKVPQHWLARIQALIAEHAPVMAGGPYDPWYRDEKPAWFKDKYASTAEQFGTSRPLGANEFVSGGNMFIRRDVLEELGGFDPRFGMHGTRVAYGEETVLQLRLRQRMPDVVIYRDCDLLLYHLVRPEKMHIINAVRSKCRAGRDWGRAKAMVDSTGFFDRIAEVTKASKALLWFVWHMSVGVLLRDRSLFPHAKSYLYERAVPYAGAFGSHWALLFGRRSGSSAT